MLVYLCEHEPCHAWALSTAKKREVGKQPHSQYYNQCKKVRLIMVQPGFCLLLLLLDLDKLLNFHCFHHNLCNGKKSAKFMWKLLKLQLTCWERLLASSCCWVWQPKFLTYKSCRWEKMMEKQALLSTVSKHCSINRSQKIANFKLSQASKMLYVKGSFRYPSGSCSDLINVSGIFYVQISPLFLRDWPFLSSEYRIEENYRNIVEGAILIVDGSELISENILLCIKVCHTRVSEN